MLTQLEWIGIHCGRTPVILFLSSSHFGEKAGTLVAATYIEQKRENFGVRGGGGAALGTWYLLFGGLSFFKQNATPILGDHKKATISYGIIKRKYQHPRSNSKLCFNSRLYYRNRVSERCKMKGFYSSDKLSMVN